MRQVRQDVDNKPQYDQWLIKLLKERWSVCGLGGSKQQLQVETGMFNMTKNYATQKKKNTFLSDMFYFRVDYKQNNITHCSLQNNDNT